MLTTLPPSCAVVMKSGNLNFLEPSGPLQACNGTALPFLFFAVTGKPELAKGQMIRICTCTFLQILALNCHVTRTVWSRELQLTAPHSTRYMHTKHMLPHKHDG